jgi:hypothetical protein
MLLKRFPDGYRQDCRTVFVPLRCPNENEPRSKIDILDPQTGQLHKAKARPVNDLRNQELLSFHKREKLPHFLDGQYDGEFWSAFCPDGAAEIAHFDFQDISEQEQEGVKCLILC